jgi:hypothetical protein
MFPLADYRSAVGRRRDYPIDEVAAQDVPAAAAPANP